MAPADPASTTVVAPRVTPVGVRCNAGATFHVTFSKTTKQKIEFSEPAPGLEFAVSVSKADSV